MCIDCASTESAKSSVTPPTCSGSKCGMTAGPGSTPSISPRTAPKQIPVLGRNDHVVDLDAHDPSLFDAQAIRTPLDIKTISYRCGFGTLAEPATGAPSTWSPFGSHRGCHQSGLLTGPDQRRLIGPSVAGARRPSQAKARTSQRQIAEAMRVPRPRPLTTSTRWTPAD